MKTRTKFALGFGVLGFLLGATLGAFTFYWNSLPGHGIPSIAVYLILCPPSFASMALDNAGIVGGIIGWFIISLANAVLYGLVGFGFGFKAGTKANVSQILRPSSARNRAWRFRSQIPIIPFEQSRPAADATRAATGRWLLVG